MVHCRFHTSLPPVPMLSQINPVHVFPFYLLKIRFHTTLPSMPKSSKQALSLWSAHQNPACTSPLRTTCPAPLIRLDFVIWIIFGEKYRSRNSSCSSLQSPITAFPLGPNAFLSTIFWNNLSVCFSLNMRDQVSRLVKTGKIRVLHILSFAFCVENGNKKYPGPNESRHLLTSFWSPFIRECRFNFLMSFPSI